MMFYIEFIIYIQHSAFKYKVLLSSGSEKVDRHSCWSDSGDSFFSSYNMWCSVLVAEALQVSYAIQCTWKKGWFLVRKSFTRLYSFILPFGNFRRRTSITHSAARACFHSFFYHFDKGKTVQVLELTCLHLFPKQTSKQLYLPHFLYSKVTKS